MFLIFREIRQSFPESIALTPDEFRHARARRVRPGDAVFVGDGRGRRLEYTLAATSDTVEIPGTPAPIVTGSEARVELWTAIPEGRRWDWLLQKATELGATVIQPLITQHSEARRIKREREERVILEAAVQSRRFFLPELREPLRPGEVPPVVGSAAPSVALDPRGRRGLLATLQDFEPIAAREGKMSAARFFVGPEGGFSESDLEELMVAGVELASLGTPILRVETAALAALAVFTAWAAA